MNVRKWLSVVFTVLLVLFSTTASAQPTQSPVEVQFGHQSDPMSGMRYTVAYITAVGENVTLTGLRVNRGNCRESIGNPAVPLPIAFGQTVKYLYMKCERLIEAEVYTNQGNWVFN